MEQSENIRDHLVEICHLLSSKGFVSATDGNVSVRLENGNFLTSRTAVNKGMMTVDDVIEVNPAGQSVGSASKPSTEIGMHLYIYSQRPDVTAVVHAHPVYATGFATARIPLMDCVFPEVIVGLGAIPLAEYATPSTEEVARSLGPYVKEADAILLTNHGVVTYGPDLLDAFFKMDKVEHAAHIVFVARVLGGEKRLTADDVGRLSAISRQSYGKDVSARLACQTGDASPGGGSVPTDEELREIVRRMIQGDQ